MFSRNILAAGTFVVSTSVLIQLSRGKKSSRYTTCAKDNVANKVFYNSESSVGTYSANDPCEDRNDFFRNSKCQIAGVFDGHGGWEVSEYASNMLIPKLVAKLSDSSSEAKMDIDTIGVFSDIEQSYIDRVRKPYELGYGSLASVGSCVCIAIAKGDRLTIANCGDCRAVLGSDISLSSTDNSKKEKKAKSKFVATRLSRDHNARIPLEVLNLQEQHPDEQKADVVRCHTKNPSACYVKGRLQLTRSLGDLYLKHEDFNARPGQPRSM
jgi:pyruvate dehydrogenase phosphatase